MSYPSYSYLTPAVLEMALDLARELRQASMTVGHLVYGGAGSIYLGGGGRVADKGVAVRDWVGPHHDTFELLFDNEYQSARTTEERLAQEADEWAQFWATAINARNGRLYDEALDGYHAGMSVYQDRVQQYQDAIEEQPDLAQVLYAPSPPQAPSRRPLVAAPTSATNYQPTA